MSDIRPTGSIELVFREDWADTPAARPMTQAHVAHPELILGLHGPGAGELKKSHHDDLAGDPYYVWSGKCSGPWAITLSHRRWLVDFRSGGVVRWRSRQTGDRQLHLVLELADGTWLISEESDGETGPWHDFEIQVETASWCRLDILSVEKGNCVQSVPLAQVSAVGVSDLQRGEDPYHCSRFYWIEVYGRPVARDEVAIRASAPEISRDRQGEFLRDGK